MCIVSGVFVLMCILDQTFYVPIVRFFSSSLCVVYIHVYICIHNDDGPMGAGNVHPWYEGKQKELMSCHVDSRVCFLDISILYVKHGALASLCLYNTRISHVIVYVCVRVSVVVCVNTALVSYPHIQSLSISLVLT